MVTGIICEYNPLHAGHKKQLDLIRATDPQGTIVCLMSGNFVQRGKPAVFDKMLRAKAAVLCGADLVLELPIGYALSSAEGFAAGGVEILGRFCHRLCFGAEQADTTRFTETATALEKPDFPLFLRERLQTGLSFPAARQAALEDIGLDASLLSSPNNILGVEYCKAIISQNSKMKPFPILRQGDYHDKTADDENPSATAVRALLEQDGIWQSYVPAETIHIFSGASVHTMKHGEKAVLAKLRTMSDTEFESLPYGSEGLWRKLMHACRKESSLEDILTAVKTKRYTRTRLDRMVMCAFLGISESQLQEKAPYTRILGFNNRGREILKEARATGNFINIGQDTEHPYALLEQRASSLYSLFAENPESPSGYSNDRVFYLD